MSEPVRVALVAEGPTDAVVVEAALRSIIAGREFVLTQLQPEHSDAFSELGTGWGGVYRWCKQATRTAGGRLGNFELLFRQFDLLVLQLDADVARGSYADAGLHPEAGDGLLPCEQVCPPVAATTDLLRTVLLSWCGENAPPDKVVLCTPSKSSDAWVVASLYPRDAAVIAPAPFECHASPDNRLSQQPKSRRIRKTKSAYREKIDELAAAWGALGFYEVERFRAEVQQALSITP